MMNAEIIRSYEHNSTFIGNAVLRSGLSLKAKGLLCTMLSLPKSWHFSVQGLSKICGEGKDSIRTGINELKARGFLQIKQLRGDGGKITGTHWVISDTPIEPEVENPNMAEKATQPEAEVPNVEKTPQYKKGINKKNISPYIPQRGNEGEKKAVSKFADGHKTKKQEREEKRAQDIQVVQGLFRFYSGGNEKIAQQLNEWLELRNVKRVPFSIASIRKNLEQLNGATKQSGLSVPEYLDQIIMRGWSGFFPLPQVIQNQKYQAAGLPAWQIKQLEGEGYFNKPDRVNGAMKRTKPLVFQFDGC